MFFFCLAKEFVSCRIQGDKPGVLILSPFVGAADLMQVRFYSCSTGTELNQLKRSLNYLPPVQIMNH